MTLLDQEQHRLVTQAVALAEQRTTGEIVPVLAASSDAYHDVDLAYASAISFTLMSLAVMFPQALAERFDRAWGLWGHVWTLGQFASLVLGLGVLGFVLGWAALRVAAIKARAIPGPLKCARVRAAAIRAFKLGAQEQTHGQTGVLLYVSLAEHRAEIVADAAIARLVPAEVWGEAMADMLAELRKGCLAEGLAAGVRDVGLILAEHFPRGPGDAPPNQLADRLIEV